MYKQIHIYDLDGTVIDSSHRYRTIFRVDGSLTIDFPYWQANKHRAMQDKLLPLAKQYREHIANPEVFCIVATARNMHEQERLFVRDILGWPDYMIARAANDTRSGADMKIDGLQKILAAKHLAHVKQRYIYEDNISYLKKIAATLGIEPIYIPSVQGH